MVNYNTNLDNVVYEENLFGDKIGKFSMIDRLGFFPTSLWKPNWDRTKELKEIINDKSQTREILNSNRSDRRNGVSGKPSVFNPDLAIKILSAYCHNNSNIYDPFAGGGTRGYIATKMGHKYSGVELREEEVIRIKKQMNVWKETFNLVVGDSQYKHYDNKFNFSYTCPPYYDLEQYSELENDLSNANSYYEFLDMIKNVLKTTYNMLEKNSFSVWVVGNFRNKKGNLEHFNGDLVRLAKEVGFNFWDEIIWQGASNIALTRVGKFEKNRKCVRMHEYVIVLKKE